jgi:hypothetical protein
VSRVKPAQVRFYVDADILGLGRILAGLRPDVTYPGDPGTVLFKKQRPLRGDDPGNTRHAMDSPGHRRRSADHHP